MSPSRIASRTRYRRQPSSSGIDDGRTPSDVLSVRAWCLVIVGVFGVGCGASPPPTSAAQRPAASSDAPPPTPEPSPQRDPDEPLRLYGFRSGVVEYDWVNVGPGRPERKGHGSLSFDDWGRKHAERDMPVNRVQLWRSDGIVTYLPDMQMAMRVKLPSSQEEQNTASQLSRLMAQLPTKTEPLPAPTESTIAGHQCRLYHVEQSVGAGRSTTDSCIAHGLMLLMRVESFIGSTHTLLEQRATRLTPNVPIDPALFEIPVPIQEMPSVTPESVKLAEELLEQYKEQHGEGGAGP